MMWVHDRTRWEQNIKNFGFIENWKNKIQYNQRYPIEKSSDKGLSHEIIPSLRIQIKKIKKKSCTCSTIWSSFSILSKKQ